tara:strand:+ start:330 stop:749 length:420 start_codon:yes stop_codon:yes gene_type:complete
MNKKTLSTLNISLNEINWKFSKSKGPGGQKINKTNIKVKLNFNIGKSKILSEQQKLRLRKNFKGKLINDAIHISVQSQREQYKNRKIALSKLTGIINECLKRDNKIRKITNPTFISIKKRLNDKRLRGELKINRKSLFH